MDNSPDKNHLSLPENAFRELKKGETYIPVIPEHEKPREITIYSTLIGILMAVFFSAAATFITLKYAQGIETAIPIAIIAIGLSIAFKKSLSENVNILAIGATSGIIAGGSVFVMPAIFILGIEKHSSFMEIMIVPLLGAFLGVLFLIPFRRYFVEEQHGKLPFPEGTATTEILMAGEKGGKQAKILVIAGLIGGIFDFLILYFNLWRENFTTTLIPWLNKITENVKAVFALNCTAAIAGLGYIMGVRYAAYIVGGSIFASWFLVPLVNQFGPSLPSWIIAIPPDLMANGSARSIFDSMDADLIFGRYVRYIGIGGIFTAGIISIIKLAPVIKQALVNGLGGAISSRKHSGDVSAPVVGRLGKDIKMTQIIFMFLILTVILWIYFSFVTLISQPNPLAIGLFAVTLCLLMAFLFTSVSAWAIATISITPISGMTLTTLIVTTVILSELGLTGDSGKLAVLLIGGVVCTALSMAGTLVTEFKIGYWVGYSPKRIQWSNMWACVISAVTVTAVMFLMNEIWSFKDAKVIPAAQGNAMAAVVRGIMGGDASSFPWQITGPLASSIRDFLHIEVAYTPIALYALGGLIAIIVEFFGISGLAFAMGIYLPVEYNTPLIIGALVSHFVRKSSKKEKIVTARNERGILFSSGLIAGGALAGVLTALLLFVEGQFMPKKYDVLLSDIKTNVAVTEDYSNFKNKMKDILNENPSKEDLTVISTISKMDKAELTNYVNNKENYSKVSEIGEKYIIGENALIPGTHNAERAEKSEGWKSYFDNWGNYIALFAFLLLCGYMYFDAMKGSKGMNTKD